MKVFAAYLAHETNSFSPIPTTLASFKELGIYRPAMGPLTDHGRLKGAGHFSEEARKRGDQCFVGLCAHAQPSRPMRKADYETLREWLLDDLMQVVSDLDIVFLFMHGAMMAEGYDDCEGDILARVREAVGDDTPIGVLLDLHCNVTASMLQHATIVMACKEYPHIDFRDRAAELYDLCVRVKKDEIKPVTAQVRVPMFGLFQTATRPMRDFLDATIARQHLPDVLSITLCHGFPWSDFDGAGASVLVVTDNNQALAADLAEEIGSDFFALRQRGQARLVTIDEAVDRALATRGGTAVIADMADNPGGGAASDSTFILRQFLERGIRDAGLAYLWDPIAVDLAFAAGEGTTLPLRIGGKVGPASGDPVDLDVTVLHLSSDANQAHIADGTPSRLGRTALVSSQGIEIALNDIRQQPFTPDGLAACGLDPWSKRILVLKSSHHFYAGFHGQAADIIYCDAPGTLNSDIRRLPFRRIKRPLWPLDDIDLPSSTAQRLSNPET